MDTVCQRDRLKNQGNIFTQAHIDMFWLTVFFRHNRNASLRKLEAVVGVKIILLFENN